MKRRARLFFLLTFFAACAPRAGSPGDTGVCGAVNDGPLVKLTVDRRPAPLPSGGTIEDGVYDLVSMVATEGDPERDSAQTWGLRLQMRFVTDQRSSDHFEGRVVSVGGPIPETSCEVGRFAGLGSTLRFTGVKERVNGMRYSARGNELILYLDPGHGRFDPSYMVFRRR